MKYIILALTSVILTSNAQAALSGYYDSVLKIKTVLENPLVANSLGQRRITGIEVKELYVEVRTANCLRGAYLKAIPPKGIGATQYEVESLTTNGCR